MALNLETEANNPKAASNQAGSMQAHSLAEKIEADRYSRGVTAVNATSDEGGPVSGWAFLRPARVVPPGAQ